LKVKTFKSKESKEGKTLIAKKRIREKEWNQVHSNNKLVRDIDETKLNKFLWLFKKLV